MMELQRQMKNLLVYVTYPNAITWEVAVEARGTWK